MPIYEYRCQSCQKITEAFVRGGNEPTKCELCGEGDLVRKMSAAGIIFKGSGFYVNDSKSTNSAGATTAGSEATKSSDAPKSEPSTSSSSDSSSDTSSSSSNKESKSSSD